MEIKVKDKNDTLSKLIKQEKYERANNNLGKHLEVCTNIVKCYLEREDFLGLIDTLSSLSKNENQSFLVTLEIIKYSLRESISKLDHKEDIKFKLFDSVESILDTTKILDQFFDDMKANFKKHVSSGKYEEALKLIINYDFVPGKEKELKEKKPFKEVYNDFPNEGLSSKFDNKIELSTKEINISSRNLQFNENQRNDHFSSLNLSSSMNMRSNKSHNLDNEYSSNNIKIIYNDGLKTSFSQSTTKLPFIRVAVDLTLNPNHIKQIFSKIASDSNYQVINNEIADCVSAIGSEFSIKKYLFNCFRITNKDSQYDAIRLTIKFSENKFERIIELASQCGTKANLEAFIKKCLTGFVKNCKKLRVLSKRDLHVDDIIKENKKIEDNLLVQYSVLPQSTKSNNKYELIEKEISLIEGSNKEATSYYEYYKILSQVNYDLGRSVEEFTQKFIDENKNISKSAEYIPHQMEEVLRFIDECVSTFYCYFNYGKPNTEKILPFCRPAVEKFIFNKLYFLISEIYNQRYKNENNAFIEKQSNIKANLSLEEIMNYSEIKPIFKGNLDHNFIPYKSTIDCINKVQFEISPKDKLDTLMKASLELRNCILDITKGKAELCSMDEELPLFIYICTQIDIKNIISELNIIDHYLKYSQSVDKESKVLTNMLVSVQFIIASWELNPIKK